MPTSLKCLTGSVVRDLLRGRDGDAVILEVYNNTVLLAHCADPSYTQYHAVSNILQAKATEINLRLMPSTGTMITPSLMVTDAMRLKQGHLVIPVIHTPTRFAFSAGLTSIADKLGQVRDQFRLKRVR